jgi:4,5:9,10-diseco-3-hydroxy-5,9,17-trioxoandrosta-1(10),2-diene-4-oate hydrolase
MSLQRSDRIVGGRERHVAARSRSDQAPEWRNGVADVFVEVDGARVHLLRAGFGPPLVMIHGLVGSAVNWRRNIGPLSTVASVYAIDLVNMGKSQRVAGLDPGLAATAERVAACMDALGIAQADIAGHSHGGSVAMMLAVGHPERVRSLILFAPANAFCSLGTYLVRFYNTAVGRFVAHLVPKMPRWIHSFALKRMYGDASRVTPDTVEGYSEGLRVPGTIPHILGILAMWFPDMKRLRDLLPAIASVPTLLVWGDKDRAVGLESGRELARLMPGAKLQIIEGAGHVTFDERPEECNAVMLEWLAAMDGA